MKAPENIMNLTLYYSWVSRALSVTLTEPQPGADRDSLFFRAFPHQVSTLLRIARYEEAPSVWSIRGWAVVLSFLLFRGDVAPQRAAGCVVRGGSTDADIGAVREQGRKVSFRQCLERRAADRQQIPRT